MSISFKTVFLASAMTVLACSAGSSAFAQATSTPSANEPENAETATHKAQASHVMPKTDHLPAMKNTVKEQPDQAPPASPMAMHRDESGRTGPVPPAQHHPRHVSVRHRPVPKTPD